MSHVSPQPHDGWRLIGQAEGLVVVEKACGLLSVPGIGPEKADCLVARVASRFPGARIVHRLDRDTSGVMVLATDAPTHRRLSMAFEARQVTKAYHALVAGHPAADGGFIDLPLRKEALGSARQVICHEQGRPSQTRWTVEARLPAVPTALRGPGGDPFPCSLLRLEPLTGRSHQLRVHLLSIGHPILGDTLYGSEVTLAAANRLCLHATELGFEGAHHQAPHPFRAER
ncbi:MAG: RluA family pseudouridine synthase [Planctomycetes bacterium]|nr:RluA family pseudouridine synthase [Planctomycetota bacterium]